MCNEAEPTNLLKTKEKQPAHWGASEAAPNPPAATMGTRHTDDTDVTGALLDKSRVSFAVQPNPKPRGTEPLPRIGLPEEIPHLSSSEFGLPP